MSDEDKLTMKNNKIKDLTQLSRDSLDLVKKQKIEIDAMKKYGVDTGIGKLGAFMLGILFSLVFTLCVVAFIFEFVGHPTTMLKDEAIRRGLAERVKDKETGRKKTKWVQKYYYSDWRSLIWSIFNRGLLMDGEVQDTHYLGRNISRHKEWIENMLSDVPETL